jgi:hypothetical protein
MRRSRDFTRFCHPLFVCLLGPGCSDLARSYEFVDSAKHFLLDAKRTKEANSRQPSGELVHLPSSPASREAERLLKPDSDRCCGTMRLVPEGRLRS